MKALALLAQMEEFSQSRYRLESRYQHVLVDELQDTSRAQWQLVELLVRAWGEGLGRRARGADPAVDLRRRRSQAVDLRLPRRRRRRARRGRASHRPAAARPRAAAGHRQELPGGTGAAAVRQRRVRRDCQGLRARRRLPLQRPRSIPADGDRWSSSPGRRRRRRARPGRVRKPWRRRCRACSVAQETVRDRRPGWPAPWRRATSPSCSARATATVSSSASWSTSACRTTSTRGSGSSTADEVKDVMALVRCLAEPDSPTYTWRPSCDRASCGVGPRAEAAGATSGRGARRRRAPAGGVDAGRRGPAGAALRPPGLRSLAPTRRSAAAGRAARSGAARERLCLRNAWPRPRPGAREPEEAARAGPPAPESRLRHARAHRRAARSADDRRRVERDRRRARRGEPDDGARRQGPRVPGRLRRQPVARHRRPRRGRRRRVAARGRRRHDRPGVDRRARRRRPASRPRPASAKSRSGWSTSR